jgi:hypothetical protein
LARDLKEADGRAAGLPEELIDSIARLSRR